MSMDELNDDDDDDGEEVTCSRGMWTCGRVRWPTIIRLETEREKET